MEPRGLRSSHFRFALMMNPKLSKPVYERIKHFFDEGSFIAFQDDMPGDLESLYKNDILIKGSIETPQKLSNYLKKLFGMKFIEPVDKKKPIRYKLTEKYYAEKKKLEMINRLKSWEYYDMSDRWGVSQLVSDQMYLDMIDATKGTLFGISIEMLENDSEKKLIFDCLKKINDNLFKIIEFKFGKVYPNINPEKLTIDEIFDIMEEIAKKDERISFYFDYPIHPKCDRLQIV